MRTTLIAAAATTRSVSFADNRVSVMRPEYAGFHKSTSLQVSNSIGDLSGPALIPEINADITASPTSDV